jgi:hypothetical protein
MFAESIPPPEDTESSDSGVRATLPTREQREYERIVAQAERLARRGDADAIAEALLAAKRKPKRTPRIVENPEYAQMIVRTVRAMVRRVGVTGDVESLADFVAVRKVIDDAITETVAELRKPRGVLEHAFSWADIGRVLGMTRQAAAEKYTPRSEGQPKRVRNRGRVPATVSPIRQETA